MSIFQILEFRPKTTLGQSLEQFSIDQDGLVWLVVVYRVELAMSDLRQLEDMNFLDRNFSKLPLLYETKHETFEDKKKKKVVVVVVVSGVVSSVGRLGETWVG